jgi:hypothetical protein
MLLLDGSRVGSDSGEVFTDFAAHDLGATAM